MALDVSQPTLFTSRGRAGGRQLAAARAMVGGLAAGDGLLVLCHYSLGKPVAFKPSPWHHLLADAEKVKGLLAGFPGRVVYMHGHVHRPWVWPRPEAELRRVVDVNAGGPCYVAPGFPWGQGFWEIELPAKVADAIEFRHHVPGAPEVPPPPEVNAEGGKGGMAGAGGGELDWRVEITKV